MTESQSPDESETPQEPGKPRALETPEEILAALDALNWRVNQLESDMRALRRDAAAARQPQPPPQLQAQEPSAQPLPPPPTGADRIARLAAAVRSATPPPQPPEEELVPLAAVADPPPPPPPPPPPRPPAPPAPTTSAVRAPRPARSVEQVIGTKWLLIGGVGLLLLGGVFFLQHAYRRGWIDPPRRCLIGMIGAFVLIALGEWAVRKKMRAFSVGLFGVGVVWLYFTAWTASPNGWYAKYDILSRHGAFAAMCGITVVGILLSLRSNYLTTAVIAVVGAIATPILLKSGRDQQVALMSYLLVVDVGFLVLALMKRWQPLALLAEAGTFVLVAGWFWSDYYSPAVIVRTSAFAWAFFAVFLSYALVASVAKRAYEYVAIAVAAVAGAAIVSLWPSMKFLDAHFVAHVVVLEAIVLAACLYRRWHWLRLGVVLWTGGALALQCLASLSRDPAAATGLRPLWVLWIWLAFALITADVLIRAWWKRLQSPKGLDVILSALAMAMLFGSTWRLLYSAGWVAWLGLYTTCIAAGAIVVGYLVLRKANRRWLAHAYFGQGLVLLALAVPIHFEKFAISLAWAIQGVVVMLIARRLRHWMLLVMSPAVVALAMLHFLAFALGHDPRMPQTFCTVYGATITNGLALAAAISAAALLAAAILRLGELGVHHETELLAAVGLVLAGAGLFYARTAFELTYLTATWWWLALAVVLAAVGIARRSTWLSSLSCMALLGVTVKYVCYDSIGMGLFEGSETYWWVVLNWKFAMGVVLAAALVAYVVLIRGRGISLDLGDLMLTPALQVVAVLFGVLLIVFAGSFEIDRYFRIHSEGWADLALAQQMTLSLWWGVYAAAMLVVGFAVQRPSVRYAAIVLLAVTLGKVFIVDMHGVDAIYRILSFLGLGALLLAASFLYHRFFRQALATGPSAPRGERE